MTIAVKGHSNFGSLVIVATLDEDTRVGHAAARRTAAARASVGASPPRA